MPDLMRTIVHRKGVILGAVHRFLMCRLEVIMARKVGGATLVYVIKDLLFAVLVARALLVIDALLNLSDSANEALLSHRLRHDSPPFSG